jgi:hypothetical protein
MKVSFFHPAFMTEGSPGLDGLSGLSAIGAKAGETPISL